MVDLLPRCVKCGTQVADSVEPEVEKGGQVKVVITSVVFGCVMIVSGRHKVFGMASLADVSPNSPRSNEANIT
jgi:hypothetical protein